MPWAIRHHHAVQGHYQSALGSALLEVYAILIQKSS